MNKTFFVRQLAAGLLILLLSACSSQSQQPTAVPATAPSSAPTSAEAQPQPTSASGYTGPASVVAPTKASGYPAPSGNPNATTDGRKLSALSALPLADAESKKNFQADAVLYGVIPSHIAIKNLGGPPVVPGWFFKFKQPGQKREYIVQVADEAVSGGSLAEPIVEPTPAEQPIDPAAVKVDTTQLFEKFRAYAQAQGIPTEGITFDVELVSLDGGSGPIWSVIDPRDSRWLYSVNATSGEVVPNPHNR